MGKQNLRLVGVTAGVLMVLSAAPAFAQAAHHATPKAPEATITWAHGPNSTFAGTRFDGEYYAPQNRVYFLGFRTTGDATDGSIWYYDVGAETYVDTGKDMPVPVSNYGIAELNDSSGVGLYIFGGRDANANIVTTVQVYHPATNTVSTVSTDPWPGTTPAGCVSLPAMGVAVIQGKAMVMGGASFAANGCADDNSAQTWMFNASAPAGTKWSAGPALNMARGYITPAVANGRIYAIGGDVNSAGTLFAQTIVETWKPGAASWDDAGVADLPQPCDESQAFGFTSGALAHDVVLAGCGQWPSAAPAVLQYDPSANAWTLAGAIHNNRRNHAGALIPSGGLPAMYIVGGYGALSSFIDPIQSSEVGTASGASAHGYRHTMAAGSAGAAVTTN